MGCSLQVHCQGQLIGVIAADSLMHAQRAAKAVKVTYEDLEATITIKVRLWIGFLRRIKGPTFSNFSVCMASIRCIKPYLK